MRLRLAVLAICVVAAISSCGRTRTPTSASATGRFNVRITDSPFSDAKAVLVTFSDVSAHRPGGEGDGWAKVAFADAATTRTCDLKKLEGAQDLLGVGTLTAGHYTQVRLTVTSARIFFANASTSTTPCAATIAAPEGASASLTIPSGEIKLNREFDVPEGGSTTMTLDFKGDASINQTGNGTYMMSPVISIVSVQ
jgi:hypothetical protein